MNIITLDFESFFTDEKDETGTPYNLTHMTTEQYVRHPWFEAHGCAFRWHEGEQPTFWVPGNELKEFLAFWKTRISHCAVLCHHAHFDGLILAHHYGIRPKVWLDTLSMARLLLGNHISVSLDSVRKQFG